MIDRSKRLIRHRVMLTLMVLAMTSPGLSAKNRFERWKEEVHWIASESEQKGFKEAQSEEAQKALMDRFWKRRDPTPQTEFNEYKELYYRRWEYVNQNFREGVAGWRTDRGRVYLIHGPPNLEEYRDIPTRGRSGTRAKRQSIVWTYFEMPDSKYFRGRMVIVFQPNVGLTEQDFTLGESQVALGKAQQLYDRSGMRQSDLIDMAVRYRIVTAGPPTSLTGRGGDIPSSGIGDFARYMEDILLAPGELLDERDARRETVRKKLEAHVDSKVSFQRLPLHMVAQDFYEGDTSDLTVTWQFPISALEFEEQQENFVASVDLLAQVHQDSSNELVDELFKTLHFKYDKQGYDLAKSQDFHYTNEFHLPPGDYTVSAVIQDLSSEKLGSAESQIRCKTISDGALILSGLVLSRSVTNVDQSGIGGALVFEDSWQVVPEPDMEFSQSERMVLFFKLYNAQENNSAPRVVVSYDFMRDGAVVKKSGPRQLTAFSNPDQKVIAFSSIIDLADLGPGDYRVQVNAIDYHAKQYSIQHAGFVIR